ncbi:urease accessory protein UreE [Sphingobacterium suaedae]|uniref:Urease accessory protein UreE n=1 Tax=Sphingobacterium suaedae TaxID=1686402 RepID=A0ABW5KHN4_9SPHI
MNTHRNAHQGNKEITADILFIEWYEVGRILLTRSTVTGRSVRIERALGMTFYDGEIIHIAPDFTICIRIKPCLCILLKTFDFDVLGHFCFEVGNRHLPLFWQKDGIALAYDGHVYPALKAKYGDVVCLETRTLFPTDGLKAFGKYS